jgi:N-acyl-D-aspartate/D-glutamate deacylase
MAVLLRGGRVIDPATGLDATADVLVADGKVTAVGPDLPSPPGCTVLDVTGCVVGPGFVDLHSHVHSIIGHRLQALDGVTTALDLEAGLSPVARALREAAEEGRPLNFGFSASWAAARAEVLLGWPSDAKIGTTLRTLTEPGWQRTSSPAELHAWLALLERELQDGALGIGVLLGYAPHSAPAEFLAVAKLAAAAGAPTFTHVRELVEADPATPVDGSEEIAIVAAETGASMHHCHVNSTSRRHVDRVLGMLETARESGSRVTVEAYPYGAGSTAVGASFLDPDRLAARGMAPSDVVMIGTGEQVTDAAHLRHLRLTNPAALCAVQFLDERSDADRELLWRSLAFPDSIVASDAMPLVLPADADPDPQAWPVPAGAATHPRTAGTFAKTLRTMVLETGRWSWAEAFRRCSWLPARVLAATSSAAAAKGHLAVGADADIVVLDPAGVTDHATFADPVAPSTGVRHLLVHGEPVVHDGQLRLGALPGRALVRDLV